MKLAFLPSLAALLALSAAPAASADSFAFGADPSWMTWQEQAGIKFFQADETTETTVEDLLHDFGFNAARLRVWVNPENYATDASEPTAGHCTKDDVVAKAVRLAAKGQDIMIAFHFSDTWADPGKQRIPLAWEPYYQDIDKLTELASAHVADVLNALAEAGVTAKWVQLGNEDAQGFMYHKADGSAQLDGALTWSSQPGYIKVFNACAATARSIFPNVLIVHHLANGHDINKITSNLNRVCPTSGSVEAGTRLDTDYLGLSLYPQLGGSDTSVWSTAAENCVQNIKTVEARYGLRSLIVEVGMNNDWTTAEATSGTSQKAYTDQCNTDVQAFAEWFIASCRRSGVCDGVFYWEPQSCKTTYASSTAVNGTGGYAMGAMMDAQRLTSTWGPRKRLVPNAYWHTVKALAEGYEPELPDEPEAGEWNLNYSLDDGNVWTIAPFTQGEDGLWRLTGLKDDTATWCMNYFIQNADATVSLIAPTGVEAETTYDLVSTLDGSYQGWKGWLQDKWLTTDHTFVFNPDDNTLLVTLTSAILESIEAFDPSQPSRWFTLQGMETANPVPGNIYIRVQGRLAAKVRL